MPWLIFWPFNGGRFVGLSGLSYHGGLIGAAAGAAAGAGIVRALPGKHLNLPEGSEMIVTLVEDTYLPYKPKRRTRATIARERGLEPLSERIRALPAQGDPEKEVLLG